MNTLGEILARLHDRSEVLALLAEGGDITTIVRFEQAADAQKRDALDIAQEAIHAFCEQADENAWLHLMGRIQNADSPGAACLSEIISWSLSEKAESA